MNDHKNATVDYNQKVLEVKHLRKYFYVGVGKGKLTVPAVDDVSFDVHKREVFGLVGESGCGKTTTGRTIIKLYNPTDGTVDLNGFRISAGYGGHIRNIKKIKREAKEQILAFNPKKFRVYNIKVEAEKKIELINLDIADLRLKLKNDIKKAEQPIGAHIADVYQMKSLHVLELAKITYDFTLKKHAIEREAENAMRIEYNNELAIAEMTYKNKYSGLKDSAALKKETIDERILALKEIYADTVQKLKEKYEPLIEEAEKTKLSSSEAKKQIASLSAKRHQDILDRKANYKKDTEAISKPNRIGIMKQVHDIKLRYQKMILDKKAEIKRIKAETKTTIAQLPVLTVTTADRGINQTQITQIKASRKEKIQYERQQIHNIKVLNRSKEALVASRKMQMIFQDPISSLNPRMTVKEIVGEGLTILGGYSDEEITERVANSLELVGLSTEYMTRYPHEFSGGQRQRIGIARALIMNPNFIIADEPISALDVSIRAQVINLLTELKEELGLTILFIAHDLSVVRFFCDRIAVMYYGKLVEIASSAELFSHPMHPYTKSLLSAIPQPDPDYEKGRKRINYNPGQHDYRIDKPSLKEIAPGHHVFANDDEFAKLQEEYQKINTAKSEQSAKLAQVDAQTEV